MRKLAETCGIILLSFFIANLAFARIPVPGRTVSWVNDYAGIIDRQTKEYLENLISSINNRRPEPVEVIVAVFKSLEGWDFNEFAVLYGERWREIKRGRRDNGVILLVALDEKRVAIGPGQNLKGIIMDTVIQDIIKNEILPEFRNENYSEGIKKGIEAIVALLKEALNKNEIPVDKPLITRKTLLLILILLLAIIITRRLKGQAPILC